jgi:hypothetical protein
MIEGPLDITALDVLGQAALQDVTKALIDVMALPKGNRTDAVMAHARQFFLDYRWPDGPGAEAAALPDMTSQTLDYLGYVLLDLAHCDQERADDLLVAALGVARRHGLDAAFRKIARKELKKTVDELARLERQAAAGGVRDA